jgi:hypothetical protein
VVFALIQRAEAEGWIDDLVAKAREENPGNPALTQVAASLANLTVVAPLPVGPVAGSGAATTGTTGAGTVGTMPARTGLLALQDLMQAPEVRSAVSEFQADFGVAVEQIGLLAGYKDLHDLLHTLQFGCSKTITAEAKRFPGDDSSREILADHELTLGNIVDGLIEVATRIGMPPTEKTWIGDAAMAHRDLQEALRDNDAAMLGRVVWRLERILSIQPSQINIRLNAAARALRLSDVVKDLAVIRSRLDKLTLDPDKRRQFEEGIANLSAQNDKLNILVSTHDGWQALDLELRRVRSAIRDDLVELEMSWPQLKQMAPADGGTEDWAASLAREVEALQQALDSRDAGRTRQAFQRYYSRASDCFYRVDLALKRLCEELRKVGEPLAFVLKVLE